MRREICGECSSPIKDDGSCDCTELLKRGWRLCAKDQGWQPIETAPMPGIGANGFGERLLLVVNCGDGTIPSVRIGYWEGTDWYLDCCAGLATDYGYRVTHWRPFPAPPAIDQARGKGGKEASND